MAVGAAATAPPRSRAAAPSGDWARLTGAFLPRSRPSQSAAPGPAAANQRGARPGGRGRPSTGRLRAGRWRLAGGGLGRTWRCSSAGRARQAQLRSRPWWGGASGLRTRSPRTSATGRRRKRRSWREARGPVGPGAARAGLAAARAGRTPSRGSCSWGCGAAGNLPSRR